jgi:hypothetical protein
MTWWQPGNWAGTVVLAGFFCAAGLQAQQSVRLNEVLANNLSLTNSDGTVTDWIELFNPSAVVVDLSNTSLTDSQEWPRRFVLPVGTGIGPGGFLRVRCSSLLGVSASNTGFGLDAEGGGIFFYDKPANGGALVDSISYGVQAIHFSIGRIPNGSGEWILNVPTPGAGNSSVALGSPSALRINEWMAERPGSDYFELYNGGPSPVLLSGLYLTDTLSVRNKYRIPALSFIGVGQIGGFALFFANDGGSKAAYVNFKLNLEGDSIGLYNTDLTKIDELTYGALPYSVSQGRLPDGGANFSLFADSPSPGAFNRYLTNLTDIVISELLTHTDPPFEDAIEFYNVTGRSIDMAGWRLKVESETERPLLFYLPTNTVVPANGYAVIYEDQISSVNLLKFNSAHGGLVEFTQIDALGNPLAVGRQAFGAARNGVSFGRYQTSGDQVRFVPMSARTFGVERPRSVAEFRRGQGAGNSAPLVGPIVINEIHYHPPDVATNNNLLDEFIELRNITGRRVPFYDPRNPVNRWRLANAIDFEFPPKSFSAPGGIVLVVGFDAADAALVSTFREKFKVPVTATIFGPFVGHLDNAGGRLTLLQPDNPQRPPHPDAGFVPYLMVDEVSYSDSTPWPVTADGAGSSLQRLRRGEFGDDPINWGAAIPNPGRPNSEPPVITVPPENQAFILADNAVFSLSATGTPPLFYQWRFNGSNLSSETNAALIIENLQPSHLGSYSAVVSNYEGIVIATAQLKADSARPSVTITSPRANARLTNETLLVEGTAKDSFSLARVMVSLNGGDFVEAAGATNWSFELALIAGTNVIQAKAIDRGSNESTIATVRTIFVVPSLFTLARPVNGTVTPNLSGQMLEVGKGYILTAIPADGYLFSHWDGDLGSALPALGFLMRSNLTLAAHFVPNPFTPIKGAYSGLFQDTNSFARDGFGFFTTTISDAGRFSAALQLGFKKYATTGKFDLAGHATNSLRLSVTNPVTVELHLDLADGTGQLTGRVAGATWSAALLARRSAQVSPPSVSPNAGNYTVLIPGDADASSGPGGDGYGAVTVSTGGLLTFAGVLGDGSKAPQRIVLSHDGFWPLHVPSYGGKGFVLGWVQFVESDEANLGGSLLWLKPSQTGKGPYPAGFRVASELIGSRYSLPSGASVLSYSNGIAAFSGGNLSAPFTNQVTILADGGIRSSDKTLTATVSPAKGLVAGKVTVPASHRVLTFKGVALQKQQVSGGLFIGPSESGRFHLGPAAAP